MTFRLILAALAVCAGVAFGTDGLADAQTKAGADKKKADANKKKTDAANKRKADVAKMKDTIRRDGKLPGGAGGASYWRNAELLHLGATRKISAVPLKAGNRSTLTTVGGEGLPTGFGKGFNWDRADNEVLLVLFINAADLLGISIDGMLAGDQVQVVSASGIASFSEDKGNPLASSIVAVLAAGAKILDPPASPLIDAGAEFAKDQFKATNAKTLRRDAFGVEPGSGHKAKEEGGLLVCLPEAGGTYYSGDRSAKGRLRWIKANGVRTDDHLPPHVVGAFFPIQGDTAHNTRTVRQSGPMYVTAWDWKFEDNAGFYKVFVKLTKGNGLPPDTIPKKKGSTAKPKP